MFQHIVIVNGSYLSVVDGSILTLHRMARYLRGRFPKVTILCARSRNQHCATDPGIEVVPAISMPFQPEYRLPLKLTRQARTLLTGRDTLIHLGAPDTLAVAALKAAHRAGTPVVSSFHSNIVSYFKYFGIPRRLESIGWRYFRWLYGQCRQVYVPTPSIQRVLENNDVKANYRPWPRGVDTERFNPSMRSQPWRRSKGIGESEILVLFVARLKWEKGLSQLTRTIETLEQRRPDVRTMVVGDGVAYRELSQRLPRTVFTGFLDHDELAKAYASADVFLYPSQTDTFGNVTLEAMASALPAVCARAPGSQSLVVDGHSGYLIEPENVSGYVNAVLTLCDDAKLRSDMGRNALRISGNYTWTRAFELLESHYLEVWNDRQRRDPAKDLRVDSSPA